MSRALLNAESCSNCRFSIEQWRAEGIDKDDADEMAAYIGSEPSYWARNLFYCRRYPPTLNLSGYTIKFVEPSKSSIELGLSDNGGLCIYDDAQKLGIFPLTLPDHWCGEWSSR